MIFIYITIYNIKMSSQEEENEPGQKNNKSFQLEVNTHKEEKKERGVVSK